MLALIREGLPNSEIATTLGVSINTVRFHVSNLLAKSGLTDRFALRDWEPGAGADPRRLPAFSLPFARPLGIAAGGAGVAAVAVLGAFTLGSRGEPSATTGEESQVAYPGAVVGTLTRQPGGLVVTEPGGSSFTLTAEMTFARWIGSQMFILGEIEGDSLAPVAGSPVGPHSRCAGVLSEAGGKVSVGGGCGGVELHGVSVERLLALRSEKVTVTILPCTESRDGRLEDPPIDAFGDEREHTCGASQAGGPNGNQ